MSPPYFTFSFLCNPYSVRKALVNFRQSRVNYYPPAGYGDATISCPFCGGTGVIPSKKAKSYILGSNLQTVATLFVIPLFCLLGFVISYLTDGSPITICYSIAIGVVLTILVGWFGASLQ